METLLEPAETLISPHGGALVNRLLEGDAREAAVAEAAQMPQIALDSRQIADLELLTIGGLSPLTGFMGSADYRSVIERTRLADGAVWPIPVTLGLSGEQKAAIEGAEAIALIGEGRTLAILRIEEMYAPDLAAEARGVYGTDDVKHPGVAAIHARGETLVAGRIDALARHAYPDFQQARLAPAETRRLFAERGWATVAGFQTRNPIHRAHEYLLRVALEFTDGLLIHPLMGETKAGDIPGPVRWRCYETLVEKYFPKDRVALSIFPANMHYAGPREAIYHALLRKNFGCTHFIVGRDHAGVGDYYGTYDAQKIFDRFAPEEIGITPLKFEHSFYSFRVGSMASFKTCPGTKEDRVVLSGTKVREMLDRGITPPPEFTRPEIADILIEHYFKGAAGETAPKGGEAGLAPAASVSHQPKGVIDRPRSHQGFTLWFTGLSGAGKSTLTQRLAPLLRARGRQIEILDGDEVRQNLSKGLGFSKEDRDTNIKRIGYVAALLTRTGAVAMTAAISPYKAIRDINRKMIGNFIEVYVECPLETLTKRDPKGLYKKALAGEIKHFTGVSDPYEAPEHPEIRVNTAEESVEQSVETILDYLVREGWLI